MISPGSTLNDVASLAATGCGDLSHCSVADAVDSGVSAEGLSVALPLVVTLRATNWLPLSIAAITDMAKPGVRSLSPVRGASNRRELASSPVAARAGPRAARATLPRVAEY